MMIFCSESELCDYYSQVPAWNAEEAVFILHRRIQPNEYWPALATESEFHLDFDDLLEHFWRFGAIPRPIPTADYLAAITQICKPPKEWVLIYEKFPYKKTLPKSLSDLIEPKPVTVNAEISTKKEPAPAMQISGATFDRLQRAITAFPDRYPDHQIRPPKLNNDVKPWLEASGLATNTAEQRVFAAIIREHFKLSPGTQKT